MELLSNDELAAKPLTADELDELDRRVARYEEDPATGVARRDLDDYLETHCSRSSSREKRPLSLPKAGDGTMRR
ncbi:MAG: hypothetical protein H6744_18170 [Deltaproteobacteria bacterium]|nr:hypothetical protein [Deltaproteobacteria bacterium]